MSYERITADPRFDSVRESHEWRYSWAARFVTPEDVVLDVACGTGYGAKILNAGRYIGVDKELFGKWSTPQLFIPADLESWKPEFSYDVFVSIETIEHIHNKENIIAMAKKAKRFAIISTPIVPTKHRNEFHVHDFTYKDLCYFLPDLVNAQKQDSADGSIKDMYGIACFKTS